MVLSVGYDINGFAWDVNSYLMQVCTPHRTATSREGEDRSSLSICLSICPAYLAHEL